VGFHLQMGKKKSKKIDLFFCNFPRKTCQGILDTMSTLACYSSTKKKKTFEFVFAIAQGTLGIESILVDFSSTIF
jgi:hypothetical protein